MKRHHPKLESSSIRNGKEIVWVDERERDYSVRLPSDLRRARRGRTTDMTGQEGTVAFGRKKKNGCKLTSRLDVITARKKSITPGIVAVCAFAWKPIPLKKGV